MKAMTASDGSGKAVELLWTRLENSEAAVRGVEQAMARLLKRIEELDANLAIASQALAHAAARNEERFGDLAAELAGKSDMTANDVRKIVAEELKARKVTLLVSLE